MIRRDYEGGLLLIPQTAHAWVSGQLALRWGNGRFARPELWEELVLVAMLHDNGWAEWELAPRIRVNSVAPGWVDTEMCDEPFADGGRERIEATIPLRRVASADDIAGPVLFLASSLARHVTGEILNVNGGSVLAG